MPTSSVAFFRARLLNIMHRQEYLAHWRATIQAEQIRRKSSPLAALPQCVFRVELKLVCGFGSSHPSPNEGALEPASLILLHWNKIRDLLPFVYMFTFLLIPAREHRLCTANKWYERTQISHQRTANNRGGSHTSNITKRTKLSSQFEVHFN